MTSPNTGRRGTRWRRLHAIIRARGGPCAICGLDIDYTIEDPNDPNAFSVDHIKSWRDYPDLREDLGNLQAAHRRCNGSKGTGAGSTTGMSSRRWGKQ